ncbi:hypothetical protein LEP1GSC079_0725 [Leptospira interrogans str. FPW1039]|uniref:Uncharacterized protein n=1 Tax=Leptospira interrogans str. FPW1039 TaxID=1193040 RepID=A0A0F6IBS7_LEPIR|nr:hypothetical protein LEP1GSC079_0725 [Leptospira interrogans str. FPW1039]EMN98525.1 hypothetical protein LEP1GSC112_2065 [Leptospira interrogans serovar Pomona str. UT364]
MDKFFISGEFYLTFYLSKILENSYTTKKLFLLKKKYSIL